MIFDRIRTTTNAIECRRLWRRLMVVMEEEDFFSIKEHRCFGRFPSSCTELPRLLKAECILIDGHHHHHRRRHGHVVYRHHSKPISRHHVLITQHADATFLTNPSESLANVCWWPLPEFWSVDAYENTAWLWSKRSVREGCWRLHQSSSSSYPNSYPLLSFKRGTPIDLIDHSNLTWRLKREEGISRAG